MEKKTKVLFTLTFPGVNTWNGRWTGEGKLYCIGKDYIRYGKTLYPNLKEGNYGYDFGDGWYANINVSFVTPTECRKLTKKSSGFCGYEWMCESILKNGKIIAEAK